jgi:predicted transcriptional regulator
VEPKATHVRLRDQELLKALRERAKAEDRSIRAIVTAAVRAYLQAKPAA